MALLFQLFRNWGRIFTSPFVAFGLCPPSRATKKSTLYSPSKNHPCSSTNKSHLFRLRELEQQSFYTDSIFIPNLCRREAAGEPGTSGERARAGEQRSAGIHTHLVPSACGQVQSAGAAAAGGSCPERPGRGVPELQTPERRCALQQPAHRDAACKTHLNEAFPNQHDAHTAPRQHASSPESSAATALKHALRCLHTSVLCLRCAEQFMLIPWFGPKERRR